MSKLQQTYSVEDEDDDVAFEEEKIVNDNIPESWDI